MTELLTWWPTVVGNICKADGRYLRIDKRGEPIGDQFYSAAGLSCSAPLRKHRRAHLSTGCCWTHPTAAVASRGGGCWQAEAAVTGAGWDHRMASTMTMGTRVTPSGLPMASPGMPDGRKRCFGMRVFCSGLAAH